MSHRIEHLSEALPSSDRGSDDLVLEAAPPIGDGEDGEEGVSYRGLKRGEDEGGFTRILSKRERTDGEKKKKKEKKKEKAATKPEITVPKKEESEKGETFTLRRKADAPEISKDDIGQLSETTDRTEEHRDPTPEEEAVFSSNFGFYAKYCEIMMYKVDGKPVPFALMREAQASCKDDKAALGIFNALAQKVKIQTEGGEVVDAAELVRRREEKRAAEKAAGVSKSKAGTPLSPEEAKPEKRTEPKKDESAPKPEPTSPEPTKPAPQKEKPQSKPQGTPEEKARTQEDFLEEMRRKVSLQFGEAQTRFELDAVIRESEFLDGGLRGDSGAYSRQDLLVLVDGLWKGELGIDNLTQAGGFRDAAYRIYKKTHGGAEPKTFEELQPKMEKNPWAFSKGDKGETVYSYSPKVLETGREPGKWARALAGMLERFRARKNRGNAGKK